MNDHAAPFKNLRPSKFNEQYKKNRLNDEYPYKCVCPERGIVRRFATLDEANGLFNDPSTGRCLVSYNTEKYQYFIAYRF